MTLNITNRQTYNLTEFPSEILEHIFKHCSWQDLPAIVLTCKLFHKHKEQIIYNLTKKSIQTLSLHFLDSSTSEMDSLCQKVRQTHLEKPLAPTQSLKILVGKIAEKKLRSLPSKEESILFLKEFEDVIKKNGIPFSFNHQSIRGESLSLIQKTLEVFSYHSAFCLIRNFKKSGHQDQTLLFYLCDKYIKRYKLHQTPSDLQAAAKVASLVDGNPEVKQLLSDKIEKLKQSANAL